MGTILENLKLYFQNNSEEKIRKDWIESEKDNVGPSVDEFMLQTMFHYEEQSLGHFWEFNSLNDIIKNPEQASDFFLV